MEKEIDGYNGLYTIDKDGNVYSYKYGKKKKLKPQRASQSKKGYFQVRLFSKEYNTGKLQYIHRLVYESFVGEIPKNKEIDHIDGDTTNNSLDNIQILSRRDNMDKFNDKKWGMTIRNRRDEFIKLYEEHGTYKKVSDVTGISYQRIYRVIKDVTHVYDFSRKVYTTQRFNKNLNDKYTSQDMRNPKNKK